MDTDSTRLKPHTAYTTLTERCECDQTASGCVQRGETDGMHPVRKESGLTLSYYSTLSLSHPGISTFVITSSSSQNLWDYVFTLEEEVMLGQMAQLKK
jgi:hypothetical protein